MTKPQKYCGHALNFREKPETEMLERARSFRQLMTARRTVRDFSSRPVPAGIIEDCVMTAATAPSGANQQPWHFCALSKEAPRSQLREAAEQEEREFYSQRAGEAWLNALAHLGTDDEKPFLEVAPWLIAVFGQRWGVTSHGERVKHYYVPESVGIASGFLIAALHNAGLATLTHTPSPMGFLNAYCDRPDQEKPYLLVVAGYPAEDAEVPVIDKKSLPDVLSWK